MILKCVLGVVARLKSRRKKSSVFTLVGLHTRRLITMAERFRRRFRVSALILCTHLCTQYLVGAPLAQIPASVRCGMEAISLWHC